MTFSVTLSVLAPGAGVPGGMITLNDGPSTVASATLTGGVAAFSVTTLGVGSHSLTAVYPGDSNYAPATSAALTLTVTNAAPGLALTSNPSSPLASGQTTILTATLPACPSATGTVTFYESASQHQPQPQSEQTVEKPNSAIRPTAPPRTDCPLPTAAIPTAPPSIMLHGRWSWPCNRAHPPSRSA